MTTHDDQIDKLERALADAYHARTDVPLRPHVMQRVMRDIRRSPAPRGWGALSAHEQLVWRTAAFAAVVAGIVALLSVGMARTTGENGTLFAEETELAYLFEE